MTDPRTRGDIDLSSVPVRSQTDTPGEALRPDTGLLRAMLEHTSDIIHVLDAEGRIRYISPSVEHVLGYAPEEMIGRPGYEFVHPKDRPLAKRTFARDIRRPHAVHRLEMRLRHRDGSWRTFEVAGRIAQDGSGIPMAVVTSHDVTERKRAEETLHALIEAAPVPIVSISAEGNVQTWNPAAERVFGWHAREVIDRISPIVPEDQYEEFRLRLGRVLQGEILSGEETTRCRKDGSAIQVRISAAPVRDAGGRILGAITVLEDITLQKRLERLRTEAVQFMGHDLRAPLASIMLTADMLASSAAEQRLSTVAIEALQTILGAADQMEALIREVADVARAEAGTFNLAQDAVSVESLLRDALTVLQPLARERMIRLEMNSAPEVYVRGDRNRLLQVISNLVANALRFTPEGGHVSIQVEPRDREVLVSVSDTGCGIEEADLPFIFDRYWQAKPRGAGSTGLGLAIAKGIVEAHGGRIWVESENGVGSTFRFTISRAAESFPPG